MDVLNQKFTWPCEGHEIIGIKRYLNHVRYFLRGDIRFVIESGQAGILSPAIIDRAFKVPVLRNA